VWKEGMAKTCRSLIVCLTVALSLIGASCSSDDGPSSDQSQSEPAEQQSNAATLVCTFLNPDGSCRSISLQIPCAACPVDFRTALDPSDSSYRQFLIPKDYATKLRHDLQDPRFAVQLDEGVSRTLGSQQFERLFAEAAELAARDGFHCQRIGRIPVCY
jgi:hypothetical protein